MVSEGTVKATSNSALAVYALNDLHKLILVVMRMSCSSRRIV